MRPAAHPKTTPLTVHDADEEEEEDDDVRVLEGLEGAAAEESGREEGDCEGEPGDLGEGDGEVVGVRHVRREGEVREGEEVHGEGPLADPLGLPEDHVDGDKDPADAAEEAVELDGTLKGDAVGGGEDAVAGDREGEEGHGERGHVPKCARPARSRAVDVR